MWRWLIAAQLAALVVLAVVVALRFTIWAPIDEQPHYLYVQTLAEEQRMPVLWDLNSPEVQAIRDRTWPQPSPTDPATHGLGGRSYEAFQPPLYYLAAVPAFLLVSDHRDKVTAVRLFDALLLATAALVLWALARAVAPAAAAPAFAGALAVLLWPGVVVRAVTISPSALELVVAPALLLALWRTWHGAGRRWTVAAGVLAGVCLLVKPTLVFLAAFAAVVVARDVLRRRDGLAAAAAAVAPAALLAPWLAFNRAKYGSWTAAGQAREQQAPLLNPSDRDWDLGDLGSLAGEFFDGVLPTEWVGQLDVWWVRAAVIAVWVLLGVGWLAAAVRGNSAARWFAAPVLLGYAVLAAAVVSADWPTLLPRYLYPVLPALALAVAAALPERMVWRGVLAITVLLAALWVDMAGAFLFTDVGDALGI